MDASPGIDAGEFGAWLIAMRAALRGNSGTEVPCGACRGCCVSGYSILVRPVDTAARSRIPAEHLLTRGGGTAVLRPRPDGRCPMSVPEGCAIYAHRPQTCLDYDCRIFTAAGIEAGDSRRAIINERVRAWRFSYADDDARRRHRAVRDAAVFMQRHPDSFPPGRAPLNPMSVAAFAVKVYGLFLDPAAASRPAGTTAAAILQAARDFDQGASFAT